MRFTIAVFLLLTFFSTAQAQNKGYIFYLHGAIVQQQGADAVSSAYGKYEYNNIVTTLSKYGYTVISEVRPKNTSGNEYASKIAAQVDSLIKQGTPANHITIIGASAGGHITLQAAQLIQNANVNYVLMGVCGSSSSGKKPCGNFYSIYESSDFAGSCKELLSKGNCIKGFQEIKLELGNGHGFLYKPYSEWVAPMMKWIAYYSN